MVRIANSVLLMLALIGAGFAWNASPAYVAASRENSRLTATVGQFAVDDQNRFHVVSVPTGNRLEWKWFVYIPANCGCALKSASRVGGDSYVRKMTDEEYGVIRVRMRNVEGTWYLWYSGLGGSARRSISATLMEDVDQFRIQAEPSQVTSFAATDAIELLSIQSPTDKGFYYRLAWGGPDAVTQVLADE